MRRDELLQNMKRSFERCLGICARKNADYAHSEDAWGNLGLVEALFPGIFTDQDGRLVNAISKEQGVIVRLADKLQRLAGATYKSLEVKDESVDDTCDDTIIYAAILKAMFAERRGDREIKKGAPLRKYLRGSRDITPPGAGPLRIHIIGPYTGDGSFDAKQANVDRAVEVQHELTRMGHYAYCPHIHTHHLDGVTFDNPVTIEHDYWIQHGLYFIQMMDDAIFEILDPDQPSDGTDKERRLANLLELPIFTTIADVPPAFPPKEPVDEEDTAPPDPCCCDAAPVCAGDSDSGPA